MSSATSPFDVETVNYKPEETKRYQNEQLRSLSTFSSSAWQNIFTPFHVSVPTESYSPKADLTWKIDTPARLDGANVKYDEFGYDGVGYPYKLRPEAASSDGGPCYSSLRYRSQDVDGAREIKEYIVSHTAILFSWILY